MNKLFSAVVFLCVWRAGLCQELTPQQYIEKYKDIAISEMKRSGVPAAITLSQGLLESSSGNSDLVKQSNNHFGIKCKAGWFGPYVLHDDDARGECFRAYDDAESSFVDHSDFLRNSPRYSTLFGLDPQDYKAWAMGLKKAGYATNPQYAGLLIDNIEKYDLNKYSTEGLLEGVDHAEYQTISASSMQPGRLSAIRAGWTQTGHDRMADDNLIAFRINGLRAVNVDSGTSLLQIANKFGMGLRQLIAWNELDNDILLTKPQIIYLQEKNQEGNRPTLVFSQNLTLYEIAQSQGVQVSTLSELNRSGRNEVIKKGTVVYMMLTAGMNDSPKDNNTTAGYNENPKVHIVEPREGLFSIARRYNVPVDQLMKWNGLGTDQLKIGQKLIVSQ